MSTYQDSKKKPLSHSSDNFDIFGMPPRFQLLLDLDISLGAEIADLESDEEDSILIGDSLRNNYEASVDMVRLVLRF
jgi:hypothetical protein